MNWITQEQTHYKRKIARIDMIGQRAIKELEDHRRKEELL